MIHSTSTAIAGNFIQTIKTEQGLTQFSFLRRATLLGDKYFVLAMDKNLKAYWFSMEVGGENWRIVDVTKVPEWIIRVEGCLCNAIRLHNQTY